MTPELTERMAAARTSVFKVVFPNTTNHYDTLFGGTALQWMDEVAFIAATRFSRQRVVTVSTSQVDFHHPIPADTIVELVASVVRVGRTSMDVHIGVFCEEMYRPQRIQAIEGVFTFVAVDEHKRPVAII